MKKINLIVACFLIGIMLSCKETKDTSKESELPWPGSEVSDINPEKTDVYFEAKDDTVIVNTENVYTELHLIKDTGEGLRPTNYTQDTLTDAWTKLIALDPKKYVTESGGISISSKKVKIIVFDNTTGQERKRSIFLGKGNSGVRIRITQSGK